MALADVCRPRFQQRDACDQRQQRGAQPVELKVADGQLDLGAEPARTDDAQDRGAADGALEAEQGIAGPGASHLRQDPVDDDTQIARACGTQRFDRPRIARFGELGVELADDPCERQPDRQHSRRRAETKDANEQIRPYDLGHAAEDRQQPARGSAQEDAVRTLGRSERERDAEHKRQRHPEPADGDALEEQLQHPHNELAVQARSKKTAQNVAGTRQALRRHERRQCQAAADRRQDRDADDRGGGIRRDVGAPSGAHRSRHRARRCLHHRGRRRSRCALRASR